MYFTMFRFEYIFDIIFYKRQQDFLYAILPYCDSVKDLNMYFTMFRFEHIFDIIFYKRQQTQVIIH